MQIVEIVRGVSFVDMERGRVCRFFVDGNPCTGVKVYSVHESRETEGMLFLTTHAPYNSYGIVFKTGEVVPWDGRITDQAISLSLGSSSRQCLLLRPLRRLPVVGRIAPQARL
jgi:hypothetical protein